MPKYPLEWTVTNIDDIESYSHEDAIWNGPMVDHIKMVHDEFAPESQNGGAASELVQLEVQDLKDISAFHAIDDKKTPLLNLDEVPFFVYGPGHNGKDFYVSSGYTVYLDEEPARSKAKLNLGQLFVGRISLKYLKSVAEGRYTISCSPYHIFLVDPI